ncbi:MAG: hypothetical protein IJ468_09790 [Lachnospiraceae bacterium]|nr:hypothetical protein [Lachnospiraceae bacterium]
MKTGKKILIALISLVVLCVAGFVAWYLTKYVFYDDYKQYIRTYEYEEGTEFTQIKEDKADVAGMLLAAENENFKLYVKKSTANVALYDKRTGEITYANPLDGANDANANGTHKKYLQSQLIIEYFNTSRVSGIMDSFSYAVETDQVTYESIENGLRVVYEIGDKSSKTGIVPIYISDERLQLFLSKMSEDDAKDTKKRYTESSVGEGWWELNSGSQKGAAILRKLNKYFESAGYTEEDYVADMTASGVEGVIPISFVIPLEYRLTEDGMEATIPAEQIVENGGGTLYRIQMLRYFGAAGMEEEGYMLVPNASGSIIYFNNGKTNVPDYNQYIYDIDPLAANYTVVEETQKARMALFGISYEDYGMLATIEEGESLASVSASVAGKLNSYNYAYPIFTVRGYDKLDMFGASGNQASLPVVESRMAQTDLTVRYTMLEEENADYAGMANYYRERLISEGVLTAADEESGDIPFYMDIIGGVKETAFILGVQYLNVNPMTTFEQAGEISKDLAASGVSNQVMNFQGWFNGGYYHDVADKIKVIRKLGGKSGLEELNDLMEENGNKLYVETAFQKVSFISKRYQYAWESAKYYGGGYVAAFGQVNPATMRQTSSLGYQETRYNIISPKFLTRYVDAFSSKIQDYDVAGISLSDLGDVLSSDKKRTEIIDRQQALDVVRGQFEILESTGKNIMVSGGNDYSFAYADDLLNVSSSDNDFFVIDENVPFYQMLIHGSIDYSSELINLSDVSDPEAYALQLIEYGMSPHYVFTEKSSNELKYTGLNMYYSTCYDTWKDDAVEMYETINGALKHVSGAAMVDHEILEDGVRKVTYSNGCVIYTNPSAEDVTVDGITVKAKSYEVEGI